MRRARLKKTAQSIQMRSEGNSRSPVDSIREAVLTVSPKRQYRGMVRPTTPATQGPEKHNNNQCRALKIHTADEWCEETHCTNSQRLWSKSPGASCTVWKSAAFIWKVGVKSKCENAPNYSEVSKHELLSFIHPNKRGAERTSDSAPKMPPFKCETRCKYVLLVDSPLCAIRDDV